MASFCGVNVHVLPSGPIQTNAYLLSNPATGEAVLIDAPGGGGKIQLAPDPVVGREGDDLLLRNFEGKIYRYPDPNGTLGR